jgi:outer membrane protein assembly factor BamB
MGVGEDNWIYASPVIDHDGTIYVGTNMGTLHAVTANGTNLWSKQLDGDILSTPALGANDFIYVGTSNTTNEGFVYALRLSGEKVMSDGWPTVVDGRLPSSPALHGSRWGGTLQLTQAHTQRTQASTQVVQV